MKYDCIKERLSELGKTQANLAAYAGITQQKLNVTLNHPELREFQIAEIVKRRFAAFCFILHYFISFCNIFLDYGITICNNIGIDNKKQEGSENVTYNLK